MTEKKQIIMHIAGKDYKVSGADSEEQLRRIEACVNEKLSALHKLFSVQGLEEEHITMLAAINLADDYIKLQKQVNLLKEKMDKLVKKEKQLQETAAQYEEALLNLETENQEYAEQLKRLQEERKK